MAISKSSKSFLTLPSEALYQQNGMDQSDLNRMDPYTSDSKTQYPQVGAQAYKGPSLEGEK